jgi:hypothetical protein
MLRIEALEARRASKNPATFLKWLDSFYAKHTQTFATAIEPAVGNWLAVHRMADWKKPGEIAKAMADKHVAASRGDLLLAAECRPAELAERVAAAVEKWRERETKL